MVIYRATYKIEDGTGTEGGVGANDRTVGGIIRMVGMSVAFLSGVAIGDRLGTAIDRLLDRACIHVEDLKTINKLA